MVSENPYMFMVIGFICKIELHFVGLLYYPECAHWGFLPLSPPPAQAWQLHIFMLWCVASAHLWDEFPAYQAAQS